MNPTPIDPALVLQAHSDRIRALALQLIRDPAGADDAAQEAWLVALRRGFDPDALPTSWWRETLRKLRGTQVRGRDRRTARETVAARGEGVEAADVRLAHEETLRTVTDAVLELDESYREVVLLRFFEQAGTAEIAARLGCPEATVRTRLNRALAQLREKLDRRRPRAEWVRALAGLVGIQRAAPRAWRAKVGLGAAVAVLAVATPFAWRAARSDGADALEPAAAAAPLTALAEPGANAARELVASVAAASAVPAAVVEPPSRAPVAAVGDEVRVTGRFLDAAARPLAGIEVRATAADAFAGGPLETLAESKASSDAGGRFELVLRTKPNFAWNVLATSDRTANARWWFGTLGPAPRIELGDLPLVDACVARGVVVDVEGRALPGEIEVRARSNWKSAGPLAVATSVSGRADPQTGAFELRGLPPGPVEVSATSLLMRTLRANAVDASAATPVDVRLEWTGPDLRERIAIDAYTPALASVMPGALRFAAIDAAGARHPLAHVPGSASSYALDGAREPKYTLVLDDARFAAWSKADVAPATGLQIRLAGSATVRVSVRAPRPGDALDGLALFAETAEPGRGMQPVELVTAGKPLPADGRLAGFLPGSWTLRAEHPKLGRATARVDALAAGETRDVELRFAAPTVVRGTVFELVSAAKPGADPIRRPAANVLVRARTSDGRTSSVVFATRAGGMQAQAGGTSIEQLVETRTDERGRYELALREAGPHDIAAWRNRWLYVQRDRVALDAGAEHELELPLAGALAARVALHPTQSVAQIALELRYDGENPFPGNNPFPGSGDAWSEGDAGLDPIALGADGALAIGPLPAGSYRLDLGARIPPPRPEALRSGASVRSFSFRPSSGLGAFEIRAGETTRAAFDAAPFAPGAIELELVIDGAPAVRVSASTFRKSIAGGSVTKRAQRDPRLSSPDPLASAGFYGPSATASVGADGRARLELLQAGEHRIALRSERGDWAWVAPSAIAVAAGETVRTTLKLERKTARVRVLAKGAPLAQRGFELELGAALRVEAKTNTAGEAELSLPAGDYRALLGALESPAAPASVEFTWPPANGVLELELAE
ncbi:MAG: sigma-70 family RNA polymerase sigma factor [Planctomycetota bacterium]|nr:MAG: sigma-70 family RNA polymerase sigma factor [Planctomycetota bacterium]